ncbi:MAG TPA: hypothetical protein VH440_10230 [Candidatus Limnocylindrales bacterium]
MTFRRRGGLPQDGPRLASAVFTIAEADVGVIDIARGPCIDGTGSFVPCESPNATSFQIWDDTSDRLEVLFGLLDAESDGEPWADRQSVGDGTMLRFSGAYVERLAALGLRYPRDPERDRRYEALALTWLASASWPRGMTPWAVEGRLSDYGGNAVVAQQRGMGLYLWVGPEEPTTLVSGIGDHAPDGGRSG